MDFIIAIKRIVEKNEEKQKVLQVIFSHSGKKFQG